MKSSIYSDQVKKIIYETVDKALIECASQHDAFSEPYEGINGEIFQPSEHWLKFSESQPKELKLTFLFKWEKQDEKIPYEMHCAPVIKLPNK